MPGKAAQDWLDKAAEDDLVVTLIRNNSGPWPLAAYHVQQASEKYIKAVLVESGIPPPKSHDLPYLLSLVKAVQPPTGVAIAASMVSAYAWLTRYPGAPPITEPNVAQAEADAATIKAWALAQIP